VGEFKASALPFEPNRDYSFKDLMWGLLMEEDSTPEKAVKVETYAWALWGNRNEVRLDGKHKSGLTFVQRAVQYLEEYYPVMDTNTSACMRRPQQILWVPPQGLVYKVNVDGAVFSDLKAMGHKLKLFQNKLVFYKFYKNSNYACS